MRVGSLFAGIGGFDLGFERAGMEAAWQVEIDPKCRELLAARFPGAKQYEDVCAVGAHNLEPVDVLCGGFPCQDLSVAGKRAGLAGERSGLFYQMTRIADELRPAWIVWENVPGLLSSHRGRDFAAVLLELERVGYRGCWTTLDARHFGLAQRRRRVFGVFARGDLGAERAAEVLALASRLRGNPATGGAPREAGATSGTLASRAGGGGGLGTDHELDGGLVPSWPADVAPTLNCAYADKLGLEDQHALGGAGHFVPAAIVTPALQAGSPTYERGDGSLFCVAQPVRSNPYNNSDPATEAAMHVHSVAGVRRLTPKECERLQGFPDGWTEGFSDTHRYRMLGNAVAVPCAAWIGRRLVAVNERSVTR